MAKTINIGILNSSMEKQQLKIHKLQSQLSEEKGKLRELEKSKKALEDEEIIGIVRKLSIKPQELKKYLSSYKEENEEAKSSESIKMQNIQTEQEQQSEESNV